MSWPGSWTPKEVEEVKSLRFRGLSYHQIAVRVGRSASAIQGLFYRIRNGEGIGKPTGRPPRPPRADYPRQAFEIPTPRRNDDHKHLALIAAANNGYGMPALDLAATYRVPA